MFSDPIRFCEDDGEARHYVAQYTLKGKADPHAGHADPSNERRDRNSQGIESDDRRKQEHDDFDDADE